MYAAEPVERQGRMKRIFLRLACLGFVTAMALRCDTANPMDLDSNGNPPDATGTSGTITGTVTAGGAPISGMRIVLSPLGRIATTNEAGVFDLTSVPAGDYTVSAVPQGTNCEPVSISLEVNQTAIVDLLCQPFGRILLTVRTPDGYWIPASVIASGPVRREAQTDVGGVLINDLPPGDYILTATTGFGACPSMAATVQLALTKSVRIVCDLSDLLDGRDLEGSWSVYLPREDDFGFESYWHQAGLCPPVLSVERQGEGIAFDSGSDTISLVGFDPDVTIVGDFQGFVISGREATAGFIGAGGAAGADGASIRSRITGTFGLSVNAPSEVFFWFFGTLTREHRDPGGDLVCTETYRVEGSSLR
jgi:hypothetical protein